MTKFSLWYETPIQYVLALIGSNLLHTKAYLFDAHHANSIAETTQFQAFDLTISLCVIHLTTAVSYDLNHNDPCAGILVRATRVGDRVPICG